MPAKSITIEPGGQDEQPSLSDLPPEALTLVAKCCASESGAHGHPLLRVARCGRDAVLQGSTRISIDLGNTFHPCLDSFAASGRLLNRACRAAATGLSVELVLGRHYGALPGLLQPALGSDEQGWHNVHKLSIEPKKDLPMQVHYSQVRQEVVFGRHGAAKALCQAA
jgi:hypothetical protein